MTGGRLFQSRHLQRLTTRVQPAKKWLTCINRGPGRGVALIAASLGQPGLLIVADQARRASSLVLPLTTSFLLEYSLIPVVL